MLIVVCGLQGTGKTTVAKKIAVKTKGVLLRTDVIRKEIVKKPTYSEQEEQKVYNKMFSKAKYLLKENRNVVLDATFVMRKYREQAEKISKNTEIKLVEVVCPEKIVKERIEKRTGDASKAKFEHYLKYKEFFDPITEDHITIDTSKNIDKQLKNFF